MSAAREAEREGRHARHRPLGPRGYTTGLQRVRSPAGETGHTDRIIEAAEDVSDPRERLRHLVGRVVAGGRSDRIHIALATAKHALVRETLARATQRRLTYVESCYAALGQSRSDARRSALIAYAAYVGVVHLRVEAPKAFPTGAALDAYVEHLIAMLVP